MHAAFARRNPVIVVAGPTASGKSALALDLAEAVEGVVINADSMQVYSDLHLLTARPSASDMARVPHSLYGMLPGHELCSAGRWSDMAAAEITACRTAGRVPIVCGGSGLYLRALMQGLSPIPAIDPVVRMAVRSQMIEIGNEAFHAELAARDPHAARVLHVGDTQRLIRAMEVFQATGRSFYEWQEAPTTRPVEADFLVLVLDPPRDELYARCDARFDQIMQYGGLAEVKSLLRRGLPPNAPIMKALGVAELKAHLYDKVPLEQAVADAKQMTRNFAKRQVTWCRGQISADHVIAAQYSESLKGEIFPIVRRFLLTGVS